MIWIKLWGLKRTGTNYVRFLLEKNFDCRVLSDVLGWKHGLPQRQPYSDWHAWYPEWRPERPPPQAETALQASREGRVRHLLLVRDPWAWIQSMARYRERSLSTWSPGEIAHYASWWSAMGGAYLDFCQDQMDALVFRYESFRESFRNTMALIGDFYHGHRLRADWLNIDDRIERGNDTQPIDAFVLHGRKISSASSPDEIPGVFTDSLVRRVVLELGYEYPDRDRFQAAQVDKRQDEAQVSSAG